MGQGYFSLEIWEIICYSIILITGLIGNSIVCIVVLKSGANFRSVPFNVYLMALALTDLCISVFGLPIYVLSTSIFAHPKGSNGVLMCKLITGYLVPFWLGAASIYLLVFISFERFHAVNRPMLSRLRTVSKKTALSIATAWIIGLMTQIPTIVGITYDDKSPMIGNYCAYTWKNSITRDSIYACTFTVQFVIPAVLFIFNFFRIRKCLAKLDCNLKFAIGDNNLKQRLQIMKRKRKTIRTVFFVSLAFFVCWTPNNVMYFLFQYAGVSDITWNSRVFQIGILLGFSSSCINPLLYSFQSKEFRNHCKRVFRKMFFKKPRSGREESASNFSNTTSSSRRTLLNFSL